MMTDLFGNQRLKVNLHTHSTLSDGQKTPEEVAKIYKAAGYDAIALTDHRIALAEQVIEGLLILPGGEFDYGRDQVDKDVFHIIGTCYDRDPGYTYGMTPKQIIDAIHEANGFAILAHPEWSLNTVEQVLRADGASDADASEIYNTVSDCVMSYRPDSSAILDRLALRGCAFPLVASDDAHYYEADACKSFVMVRADEVSVDAIREGLRRGDYYASQGPELHAWVEGNEIKVKCSPVSRINFHTGFRWRNGTVVRGENLTEAVWKMPEFPGFVRVSVEDAQGRRAWTSYLNLDGVTWEKQGE